jgi:flagellar basal body P-ring formation protein FlgA
MNSDQPDKELTLDWPVSLTRWLPLLLAMTIQLVCFPSFAVEFHDHDDILTTAEKQVLKLPEIANLHQPFVSMDRLDSRLRLKKCSEPLQAVPSPGGVRSGKTTIAVHCYGTQPWKLYVPAKIESTIDTVKLTRSLPRGAILSASDLSLTQSRRSSTTKPLINSIKEAQGAALRRALARGTELTQSMLEAPLILKRGEQTIILAGRNGLEVRMSGKALQDGAEGEFIRVQNLTSKRTVQGRVRADGSIEIDRW